MTAHDYQKWVEATRDFPHEHKSSEEAMIHFAIGLAGETGEVAEYVKKHTFCLSSRVKQMEPLENELGDVVWYLTALCCEAGVTLEQVMSINHNKICNKYNGVEKKNV